MAFWGLAADDGPPFMAKYRIRTFWTSARQAIQISYFIHKSATVGGQEARPASVGDLAVEIYPGIFPHGRWGFETDAILIYLSRVHIRPHASKAWANNGRRMTAPARFVSTDASSLTILVLGKSSRAAGEALP